MSLSAFQIYLYLWMDGLDAVKVRSICSLKGHLNNCPIILNSNHT